MSMSSALSNVGGGLQIFRNPGRIGPFHRRERVATSEVDHDEETSPQRRSNGDGVDDIEEDSFVNTQGRTGSTSSRLGTSSSNNNTQQPDIEQGQSRLEPNDVTSNTPAVRLFTTVGPTGRRSRVIALRSRLNDNVNTTTSSSGNNGSSVPDADIVQNDSEDADEDNETDGLHRFTVSAQRATMTLAELEEERELARRRSTACVLFALFILFRLWIMALQEGDFGLLILCLIGTSWTARWIRYNREQEEELDRRIANYIEQGNNNNNDNNNTVGGIHRSDLRLLSFQAQLALAIMESQRQMMEGGYGHPDGESNRSPGVTDEAKAKWETFSFKQEKHKHLIANGYYGSVSTDEDDLKKSTQTTPLATEEEPHCSICLGEYEEDESLARLPCGHLFHKECISSWCSNHTRCPLCNYDLNSVTSKQSESLDNSATPSNNEDRV